MMNTHKARLKNDKNDIYSTFKAAIYMISLVWKKDKKFVIVKFINAIITSFLTVPYIVIPGLIINELILMKLSERLLLYVAIIILTPLVNTIFNRILSVYLTKATDRILISLEADLYYHIVNMDYEVLENPEIQTLQERAQNANEKTLIIIDQLCGLLFALIKIFSLTAIIISMHLLIIIPIIVIAITNAFVTKWLEIKNFKIDKEVSRFDRYRYGISSVLESFFYAKELRIFDLQTYFIEMYKNKRTESNSIKHGKISYQNKASIIIATTNILQQIVVYGYILYAVLNGVIDVGTATVFLSATGQFAGALDNVFRSYIKISSQRLYVNELLDFMNIKSKQDLGQKNPIFNEHSVIEFVDVSFRYPNSENYALKNINITIHGNEKLCIVGSNGSGKSTFIKLLTRLYVPERGRILLNGVDINEYDYKKYQRLFSPVFQDYCMYHLTLKENIVLSNTEDVSRLNNICINANLIELIGKLPKGLDTPVYKWEAADGFEPSGGEEQRIAIARSCYRDGKIFLLDEPTSALDPLAEYEIYTQFNKMITDKCAVLITHRLSAVQLADKVAVFDNGSVVEYGTHKELYEKGGIYTEMFDKQAQFYRDEKSSNN